MPLTTRCASPRMYTRLLSALGLISVHLLKWTHNTNTMAKAQELSRLLLDVWIHSIQYSNSIFHKLGEYFEFERYFKMACGTFIWAWDFNLSVSINTDEHFVLLLNRLIQAVRVL
ncbi:hypothetical protein K493DRAFT_71021 [Basidiobolus meristosporus CBS 931.73]|uniref:Uncharacterized protein n=1 Tax=Basidiobolus meristosporus CBS 931.73 TaxID=1314790 RepID=A0A1Y1YZB4_9FUNG|nr:hypothetical protein K493DRAFT_71021 [Basidiobolus meristosporus CBS 931.73]|eukprot:ORY03382.1 hypothetical protein K493DRAFT_71021 [Basidiobolus meristosporus CBS 931.73]